MRSFPSSETDDRIRGIEVHDQNCSRSPYSEVPDSQEAFDEQSSQDSADIIQTVPCTAKPTRDLFTLHSTNLRQIGRLPMETPQYQHLQDMADEATQPATQLVLDPRLLGRSTSGLSRQDLSDVVCLLHPASTAAIRAVSMVARATPQHVLQDDGLSAMFADESLDQVGYQPDIELEPPRDIALRLSSRLINPSMGFCFGRNPQYSDIIIGGASDDTQARISNVHFRIYLNQNGMVMLHDLSTNGTVVDHTLLCGKRHPRKEPPTRMLNGSSVISLITKNPGEDIKFIVRYPSRGGQELEYKARLQQYITATLQYQWGMAKAARQDQNMGAPHAEVYPSASSQKADMKWDGGDMYNVVEKIGSGAFASVWKIATKHDGRLYACKEIEKRKFIKNGILDMKIDNEMNIMKRLRHPNIVQYIDYVEIPTHVYIIMEFIPHGDLRTHLELHHRQSPMPERRAQTMSKQILEALKYLHAQKITHRDIKPDNILISQEDPWKVKISDFGLSKAVENETMLKTFCGTLLYCAPEVFPYYQDYIAKHRRPRRRGAEKTPKFHAYSSSVDVWSYGVVLFYVLTMKQAFHGTAADQGRTMLENIIKQGVNIRAMREANISNEGIDIVSKMLTLDPSMRPTETALLSHPWLVGLPEEADMDMEVGDNETGQDLHMRISSQLSLEVSDSEDDDHLDMTATVQQLDAGSEVEQNVESTEDIHEHMLPTVAPPTQQLLFGEIRESALESSGVLGHNADQVLKRQLPPFFEKSAFSGYSSDSDPALQSQSETNDSPEKQGLQPPPTLLRESANLRTTSSLQGAEAMVGRLNMCSSADVPISTNMQTVAGETGVSATSILPSRQRELSNSAEEHQAKRAKFDRTINLPVPASYYWDPADKSTHTLEYSTKVSGFDYVAEARSKTAGADIESAPAGVTLEGVVEDQHSRIVSLQPQQTSILESNTNSAKRNDFARPNPILGRLVAVPGSCVDYSIKLDRRVTTFGRSYGATVRCDPADVRISREALEIRFTGPGVLAADVEGRDWMSVTEDIWAVIRSPSRDCYVNDVTLQGGPKDGGWYYGKLHTGDVIQVFELATGEYLRFRCEFFFGKSKEPRLPAQPRFEVQFEHRDWESMVQADRALGEKVVPAKRTRSDSSTRGVLRQANA